MKQFVGKWFKQSEETLSYSAYSSLCNKIYCRKYLTLSNQTSRYIRKWIRICIQSEDTGKWRCTTHAKLHGSCLFGVLHVSIWNPTVKTKTENTKIKIVKNENRHNKMKTLGRLTQRDYHTISIFKMPKWCRFDYHSSEREWLSWNLMCSKNVAQGETIAQLIASK